MPEPPLENGFSILLHSLQKLLDSLQSLIDGLEKKFSVLPAGMILSAVLLFVAAVYVRPAYEPFSYGVYYAKLSEDPFSTQENPNAYRILTPLIAYLLGLRGNAILILNLLVVWGFLVLVYSTYRPQSDTPLFAMFQTALLAFSMPILYTVHYNGYPDPATYVILFMMMLYRHRVLVFWILFTLGLLNHESIAFLLPFFVVLEGSKLSPKKTRFYGWLAGCLVSIGVYLFFRRWIESIHPHIEHNTSFYFGPLARNPLYWLQRTVTTYYAGFFSAFKLFWLIPLAACYAHFQKRQYRELWIIVLPVLCAVSQSFFAFDTSRMISLAFPAILLGMETLEKDWKGKNLDFAVFILILINFLVPQICVTGSVIVNMKSSPEALWHKLVEWTSQSFFH